MHFLAQVGRMRGLEACSCRVVSSGDSLSGPFCMCPGTRPCRRLQPELEADRPPFYVSGLPAGFHSQGPSPPQSAADVLFLNSDASHFPRLPFKPAVLLDSVRCRAWQELQLVLRTCGLDFKTCTIAEAQRPPPQQSRDFATTGKPTHAPTCSTDERASTYIYESPRRPLLCVFSSGGAERGTRHGPCTFRFSTKIPTFVSPC